MGQNLKYDLLVLSHYGVEVAGPLFDTMLAHYVVQPEQRHNMDLLAEKYLHYRTIPIELSSVAVARSATWLTSNRKKLWTTLAKMPM